MSFTDTTIHLSVQQPTKTSGIVNKKNTNAQWAIEQLHIHRYQHILEVGFKNGRLLQEAAERLGTGLIAGIDDSVDMYKLAVRKNRQEIGSQMMQLHFGSIGDLPYPPYYFDTIFGYNSHSTWNKPENIFMQLHRLLKAGGRFVLFFEMSPILSELRAANITDGLKQQFTDAGFSQIQISSSGNARVNCVALTGFKP
jgi:SAM-dependent methyltransferase